MSQAERLRRRQARALKHLQKRATRPAIKNTENDGIPSQLDKTRRRNRQLRSVREEPPQPSKHFATTSKCPASAPAVRPSTSPAAVACVHFVGGFCARGARCRFSHDPRFLIATTLLGAAGVQGMPAVALPGASAAGVGFFPVLVLIASIFSGTKVATDVYEEVSLSSRALWDQVVATTGME